MNCPWTCVDAERYSGNTTLLTDPANPLTSAAISHHVSLGESVCLSTLPSAHEGSSSLVHPLFKSSLTQVSFAVCSRFATSSAATLDYSYEPTHEPTRSQSLPRSGNRYEDPPLPTRHSGPIPAGDAGGSPAPGELGRRSDQGRSSLLSRGSGTERNGFSNAHDGGATARAAWEAAAVDQLHPGGPGRQRSSDFVRASSGGGGGGGCGGVRRMSGPPAEEGAVGGEGPRRRLEPQLSNRSIAEEHEESVQAFILQRRSQVCTSGSSGQIAFQPVVSKDCLSIPIAVIVLTLDSLHQRVSTNCRSPPTSGMFLNRCTKSPKSISWSIIAPVWLHKVATREAWPRTVSFCFGVIGPHDSYLINGAGKPTNMASSFPPQMLLIRTAALSSTATQGKLNHLP